MNYITETVRKGYRIALDDAFTGNNGLSRFMDLPWGELKLDRSLLVQIDSERVQRGEVGAVKPMPPKPMAMTSQAPESPHL